MSLTPKELKPQQSNPVSNDVNYSISLSEKFELSNLKKELQIANKEILSDFYKLHKEEVDTMNKIARYTAHLVHKNQVNGDVRLERIFNKIVLQHKLAGKVKNRDELNLFLHDILNFNTLVFPTKLAEKQQIESYPNNDSLKISTEKKECSKSDKSVITSSARKRQVKRVKKRSVDENSIPKKKRKQVCHPVAVTKLVSKKGPKSKGKSKNNILCFVADARKTNKKRGGAKPAEINFIIGNSSYACKELLSDVEVDDNGEYVAPKEFSHQWLMYVKEHTDHPSMLHLIKSVQFYLHDSYKDSSPIIESKEFSSKKKQYKVEPYYSVENMGWGEFEVVVVITFKSDLLKQVEHRHDLKLYNGPDIKISQFFNTHVKILLPSDFPDCQFKEVGETSSATISPEKSVVKDLFAENCETKVEEDSFCKNKIDIPENHEEENLDDVHDILNEEVDDIEDILGQAESVNSFTSE